ncbi:SulP family inorganic anion transporter [Streptomyces phaeoluteigriseus]|uniref:SulP family inorganic anion transporter n=1 Tax=Streptomyces phaeoluteigriseus TaxID=114686 RepID=A0ABY4ZGJ4_9ACTN|nr:SulP family inorganic anion transporter [Streptomyces phaeoluteigriseus]USQ88193.1 SulP family inorganic anion transporter [Streptomyces phaeoluteigriseus]
MSGAHARHARGRSAATDGAGRTFRMDAGIPEPPPRPMAPPTTTATSVIGEAGTLDEAPAGAEAATVAESFPGPKPYATAPAAAATPRKSTTPRASTPKTSARKTDLITEITASLVVFLVALPLCIGVAVASGVPAELGIISGVIGGLVVGAARGSTLQVSGPAAGLAALVAETVLEHGVAMLGVIVLFSGLLQIVLGLVRFGRFFQAISLAVVQGMLAGIGLPLMFSQAYPAADAKAPGTPIENMAGVPGLLADTAGNPQALIAAGLGILTVVLSFLWKKVPGPVGKVPAALVAVGIGIAVAALPGVDVRTLQVGNLLASVDVPGAEQFAGLADAGIITAILTFTVIASAESLFTAAAVDRMHDGPRTRYNPELIAQGAGNTVAGLLGALPITAVVARSSANVQAGAKTRLSRTLHGLWLLAFALLLPQVLALIPISVLAGVLIHSGWKLFAPQEFPKMWRQDRGECAVMTLTTLVIVATALLEGVLVGLAAGIVLAAVRMSQTVIRQDTDDDTAKVVMAGNATFLRLPQLIEALEAAAESEKPRIRLDLTGVTHLDHACRSQVEEFVTQQRGKGLRVELLLPGPAQRPATPGEPTAHRPARPDPLPRRPTPSPGPTAEWFYLDTRPMPEDFAERYAQEYAPGYTEEHAAHGYGPGYTDGYAQGYPRGHAPH